MLTCLLEAGHDIILKWKERYQCHEFCHCEILIKDTIGKKAFPATPWQSLTSGTDNHTSSAWLFLNAGRVEEASSGAGGIRWRFRGVSSEVALN